MLYDDPRGGKGKIFFIGLLVGGLLAAPYGYWLRGSHNELRLEELKSRSRQDIVNKNVAKPNGGAREQRRN